MVYTWNVNIFGQLSLEIYVYLFEDVRGWQTTDQGGIQIPQMSLKLSWDNKMANAQLDK